MYAFPALASPAPALLVLSLTLGIHTSAAAVQLNVDDDTACVPSDALAAAIDDRLPDEVAPADVRVKVSARAVQWERALAVQTRVGDRVHERTVNVKAHDCASTPMLIASIVARDAAPLTHDAGGRAIAGDADPVDAPAPLVKPAPAEPAPPPAPVDDVGLLERYAPLTLDDDLVPELEDNWIWFVVGGLFSTTGGHLWVPLIASKVLDEDLDIPEGYLPAALKIIAAHLVPHAVLFGLTFCGIPMLIIPPIGIVWFLGFWMLNVFGNLPAAACNSLWLTPVALVNEFNRRAKAAPVVDQQRPGSRLQANAMAF